MALVQAYSACSGQRTIRRLLFVLALAAAAGTLTEPALAADPWSVTKVDVTETMSGQPGIVATTLETASNGDAKITINMSDGHTETKGTLLLITGRWIATRDLVLQSGNVTDYLDAAALNSQFVLALLKSLLPGGPLPPGRKVHLSFAEKDKPIRVSTKTANGNFAAPWSVEADVDRATADSATDYQMDFTYSRPDGSATVHLSGEAGVPNPPFNIADETPLADWKIYEFGKRGAQAPAATVGELRARP